MRGKSKLALVSQPQEYFRELVTEAMESQKVSTQPETEFYLVNLLNRFMTTENLYVNGPEGEKQDPALALMIKEALEEPVPHVQEGLFRKVGDVSLYVAGFFQDSLNRKLVDVDYYIDMGGTAYQHVAVRVEEDSLKSVYCELADKFASLVDVLAEVSDKTSSKTEKDILRIYELWIRTKSERAAKALQEAGILPNDTLKKDWQ